MLTELGIKMAIARSLGEVCSTQPVAHQAVKHHRQIAKDNSLCDNSTAMLEQASNQMLDQAVSMLSGSNIKLHQAVVLQPGEERMVQRNGSGTHQNHTPVTVENQSR